MAHRLLLTGFLAMLLAAAPVEAVQVRTIPGQESGTVRGTVSGLQRSGPSPLANAVVTLTSGDRYLTVTTDEQGRYTASDLHPGAWRVKALHVGYRPMSAAVRLPAGEAVTLDLSMVWEPIPLPGLLIQASPVQPLRPSESPPPDELGEVAIRALEGSSGMVEGGLTQIVSTLPGNDPSDPQDVLLMRGSAADLKLVLLDGAPVYTPFHMAGLLESFDPGALGGATLFLGGAPAQFDGGLSYILDLHGRSPRSDGFHGEAAIDFLTGRFLVEGPVSSSTGFLLGSRVLHNLGTSILSGGSSPYGFGDALARFAWNGGKDRGAFLTGFWNQESVSLDFSNDQNAALQEEIDLGNSGVLSRLPEEKAQWGNRALSAGFWTSLGDTHVDVRAAVSRYEAELPLGDSLPVFAQSRTDRTRVAADFSRPWQDGSLRFGVNLDLTESAFSAMAMDSSRVGESGHANLDGATAGAYLELSRPISESFSIRGGGRIDRFRGDKGLRVAPRFSLTWMLTENAALTVAAGRYHQYSSVTSNQIERTLEPDSSASPWGDVQPLDLSVGTANHLVVSLDQILTPGLRLGLEGFVKEFSGVAGIGGQNLNASGVDIRVAREGRRAAGWLGYTLTWFWASDGLFASGDSPFSGRHLLSAGLTAPLTENAGLRVRASYGDGLPFTSVPVFAAVNAPDSPLPPTLSSSRNTTLDVEGDKVLNSAPELTVGPDEGFLRLEVEVYGRWSPRVSGRTMELRPYLRVLNALNRRDALFYHFDPWRTDGPEPLADLPVLPLVGLEWRF